jgi:hypothetical protein
MKVISLIAGMFLPILIAGCSKTNTTTENDTPSASPDAAPAQPASPATPAAAPVASTAPTAPASGVPTPRELAPPGVFYLVETARIETTDGISGLPPGTGVKLLHDDVYLTPAGEARLRPDQITNDMALARAARNADRAAQAAAQARIAADGAVITARERADATGPGTAQPQAAADAPATTPTATPAPLGSSLSRPQDVLNSTHSSTKDKVYNDSQGTYWKDVYGRKHYF